MINSMIAAFITYFTFLLGIGFYFYYTHKSENNLTLGNKKLNYWITAISAQASDMSDWLFMGFPGLIYATGLEGIWTAVGLVIFMFLNWHFIAPKFRVATESHNSATLASFLQKKFGAKNNAIRIISGLLCLSFFIFYIAAGLAGLGKIFEFAFAINYYYGILLGLSITLAYLLLGGLLAVAWSNLFQGVFLLIVIALVPLYASYKLGGIYVVFTTLKEQSPHYLSAISDNTSILDLFFASMAWGLGYFGQPHILISFMNIDNVNNMKKAKYVGIAWQISVLTAAIFVGLVSRVFINPELINPELVFISMVTTLFAPFLAGIILCAMLAATISTINTQALVSAALITEDLYHPFIKSTTTSKQKLFIARSAIFIIPLLALLVSFYDTSNIFDIVFYAWSGLGCSFGPLVILSLYSTFVTPQGATAGLIVGGLTGIFWPISHTIPPLVIGFVVSFCTVFIVSKITQQHMLKKE